VSLAPGIAQQTRLEFAATNNRSSPSAGSSFVMINLFRQIWAGITLVVAGVGGR
jgi:hypothetical protein